MSTPELPIRHRYKELKTDDYSHVENPIGSHKYDGAAFFLSFDKDGTPKYISRRVSVKGAVIDRTANIPHLSDFKLPEYHGQEFHVELYHSGKERSEDDIDHAVVSGILNSLPKRAIATQEIRGPVRAAVLDIVKGHPQTFAEKLDVIKDLVAKVNKPDLFHHPEYKIGKDEIDALLKHTSDKKHEGVIVTSLTTPESDNVRYKVKHYQTYNLRITSLTQEVDIHGKPKNSTGAFVVVDATGKEVANVGTGISREIRIESWKHPEKWIGKLIQVKAMPTTADRLRHPIYNGDADGELDTVE